MNSHNISLNQRTTNDGNYKNNIPNSLKMIEDINENIIDYEHNLVGIDDNQNIQHNKNQNLISATKKIFGQNENINSHKLNNYLKIIQDLQYSNAFLNNKNLNLESELEYIKNKYNSSKNEIDDINKHISICKDNQEKIISDLIERNNYLENLISKDKIINIKSEELLGNKNNINLHLFVYKMKKIFNNDINNIKIDETINDEDYLNNITNNIIKMNDELIKYKKELEEKEFELNKLKKENQILKLKLQEKFNNKAKILYNDNNPNYYNSSKNYIRMKTPIERKQLIHPTNDNITNISNFDYKDNYSNYSYNQQKLPLFFGKYKSQSPSPLKNNLINHLSKITNVSDFKFHAYNTNTENIQDMSFLKRSNGIKEKKLINSRSIGALKYKSLNDFENDKNNNKYQLPKATLVYQQCQNSKNSLQSLMNNVAQLENVLKDAQNNIYENDIDNN